MRGILQKRRAARLAALVLVLLVTLAVLVNAQPALAKKKKNNNIVREDGIEVPIKARAGNMVLAVKPTTVLKKPLIQKGQLRNLPPLPNSPESVIGADGRKQVTATSAFPNSAIAQIEIEFAGLAGTCTGWFIDSRRLATAAHCLYDSSLGGFATGITVYPGRNGAIEPYGHFAAAHWYVINHYIETAKPKFDFGVIELDTDIGAMVGSFGYMYDTTNTILPHKRVRVRGYPGDKPYGTLWTMGGNIGTLQKTRFFYAIDTYGGQSGSPAFGNWEKCRPCGFGIHTYGVDWQQNQNSATRLTRQVFNFFGSAGVP